MHTNMKKRKTAPCSQGTCILMEEDNTHRGSWKGYGGGGEVPNVRAKSDTCQSSAVRWEIRKYQFISSTQPASFIYHVRHHHLNALFLNCLHPLLHPKNNELVKNMVMESETLSIYSDPYLRENPLLRHAWQVISQPLIEKFQCRESTATQSIPFHFWIPSCILPTW